MKEATGEMTMTIIVIVAAVAILAIAPTIWNLIQNKIETEVNGIDTGTKTSYIEVIDKYYI